MEKQAAAKKAAGEKNAREGKKFLAENKKKEGVKTTASGLQYKVLKEGTGASPKATDTVITQLSRDDDRWDGIRQFLQAWTSRRPSRSIASSRAGPKRCS